MKILIHGGLHKTASTSFQKLCNLARKKLADQGIIYPRIGREGIHFNHNYWLDNAFYDGDFSWCKRVLRAARSTDETAKCILLSAENLEYFSCKEFHLDGIKCSRYPRKLEKRLLAAGATSVDWVFTFRDPVDYHASLYNQFAAGNEPDRPIIDFLGSAMIASKWGGLQITSYHQNHRFIFDYPTFMKSFSKQVSGRAMAVPFTEMVQGLPGDPLLLFASGGLLTMANLFSDTSTNHSAYRANASRSWKEIEMSYVKRFLGKHLKVGENHDLITRIANIRVSEREQVREQAKSLLSQRFPDWQDVFGSYPLPAQPDSHVQPEHGKTGHQIVDRQDC